MPQTGIVRRTDLQFRGEYPDILTTIYKLSESDFLIYCETTREDQEAIIENFDNSIKPFTAPVRLIFERPETYSEIIPPISDREISKDFEGVFLSAHMLFNLLLSKFPNIRFYKIERAKEEVKILVYIAKFSIREANVVTYKFLSNDDREKIIRFLEGLKLGAPFEIINKEVTEIPEDFPQYEHEPIRMIHASKLRKDKIFDFAQRDEALWFDNVDKIFEGSFYKKELFFFNPDSYSCYVDFSAFSNIDLRNHLLLFQTVYITLPFERNIEKWLNAANIAKNEFLDLIVRNRVKLVLTQMESRYDIGFIMEAFSANPEAVVSRRALATLQQIDIVETSDNYILNDPALLSEMVTICTEVAKQNNIDPSLTYELLVWPLKARRKSFDALHQNGIFSTSVFGINNAIEKQFSLSSGKDLSFEFTMNASAIHLASALEATYFPFYAEGYSDQFYANTMGDFLNFYKNASIPNLATFIDNKQQIQRGVIPINPVDIIDINTLITIPELESEIAKNPTFQGGKLLMETLAQLDEQQRDEKIKYYNDELVKTLNGNRILPNAIDLGTNVALDAAGIITGFPYVGSLVSVMKMGGKVIKNAVAADSFTEKIETALNKNPDPANIHYLTKINRVARIKRKF